jgi:hypothetical protein
MENKKNFEGCTLSKNPNEKDINRVRGDYEVLLVGALEQIIDRYESSPDYPWIDTKFEILTGKDFPDQDVIREKSCVYGWVQGRALESIVTHTNWLIQHNSNSDYSELIDRCDKVIRQLVAGFNKARDKNAGHFYFLMNRDGQACDFEQGQLAPIKLTGKSPYNFSDVFCSKGLYAAGCYLKDKEEIKTAEDYCYQVLDSLWAGNFKSDEIDFNSETASDEPRIDKISHAPFTIAIGIANLMVENNPDGRSISSGTKLIDYIMDNHVNYGQWNYLDKYDFVEFLDSSGQPYKTGDQIYSDPGHSLEFVGLSAKFCYIMKQKGISSNIKDKLDKYRTIMPEILIKNFQNGYQPDKEGICKLLDLVSGSSVKSEMPCWSLPETMRASLYCSALNKNEKSVYNRLMEIYSICHNAFIKNYLQPEINFFGIQMRRDDGKPEKESFPAFPDADPSYHVGLSVLDCVTIIDELYRAVKK